jgi:hypothetical protein
MLHVSLLGVKSGEKFDPGQKKRPFATCAIIVLSQRIWF